MMGLLSENMSYKDAVSIFKQYSGLNVENMSASEIKNIYRKLVVKYHPDKNSGNEVTFKKIKSAYESLLNPKHEPTDSFGGNRHKSKYRDRFDDLMKDTGKYQNQYNQEYTQKNQSSPKTDFVPPKVNKKSIFQRLNDFFKLNKITKEDKDYYSEFYRNKLNSEKYWKNRYDEEGPTSSFINEYENWKNDIEVKEKNLQKYLKNKYYFVFK